jgi:hypothetical protein
MNGTTLMIIIGIFLLVVGGGLMLYGIEKHEDKGEKTTTHKLMLFGGAALVLIGVGLIIAGIFFKKKSGGSQSSMDTSSKSDVSVPEMPQIQTPSYSNMGMGFGQPYGASPYNSPMPGFTPYGYGASPMPGFTPYGPGQFGY